MPVKLTTEEFIKRAKRVHGDIYDYSEVIYNGAKSKVAIICKEHGLFLQTPSSHIQGHHCIKCGDKFTSEKLKNKIGNRKGVTKWSNEAIEVEAQKYTKRTDFFKYAKGAYTAAQARGTLAKVCKHMPKTVYTHYNVKQLALKCKTRGEFRGKHSGAYAYAIRNSILDKICAHMHSTCTYYTDNIVQGIASLYHTRGTFKHNNVGAYEYAVRHNILDAICTHMVQAITGFDKSKPGILYYLRVEGGTAYKIGITNYSVKDRYRGEELDSIVVVKEWYYVDGAEARRQEQKILREYSYARYTGPSLLYNGNTELFDRDILLLDN